MKYASLIGPLYGCFYPLPEGTEEQQRLMLSTSRLAKLWCLIYDEEDVDQQIERWGGHKLPKALASHLDYDHDKVFPFVKEPA